MSVTCVQAGSHIHSMSLLFTLTARTYFNAFDGRKTFNFIHIFSKNTGNWFQVRELHVEIPEYEVNKPKVQEIVQY